MNIEIHSSIKMVCQDHPRLLVARSQGPDAVAREIELLKSRNHGKLPVHEYRTVREHTASNAILDDGWIAMLDRFTGHEDNYPSGTRAAFYAALFEDDATLLSSFDGDFGAASGGTVTEFTDYDEATRPNIVFGATTRSGNAFLCTYNATGTITISEGVTNKTLYGVVITNINTKQYDGGLGKAISALKYAEGDRPVVSEAEVWQPKYQYTANRAIAG